jgi:enamine deaminase RidA (YjgF/YER057c/UK114 family)
MKLQMINPEALGAPKGWNNGVLAPRDGRVLFIAGQAGWETDLPGTPPPFLEQFARALDRVLAIIREAGGAPTDLARLTIYVTNVADYHASVKGLGRIWRERLEKHYPAVALLEVKGLVDRGAVVEMEATAVIGGGGGGR